MNSDSEEKKLISVGPWGGRGGEKWDDGEHTAIRQIVIVHGAGIDSMRFEYDNKGTSIWSDKHGGRGGSKTDTVKLEHPEEYLTSMLGHYGALGVKGPVFVRSLSFESNKKKYGPFGSSHGEPFSFPSNGAKIVGFHGKGGLYLDAIGVHLKPIDVPKAPLSPVIPQRVVSPDFIGLDTNAKIGQGKVITYGPWGSEHVGNSFDDGTNYTGIRQIYLARNVGIAAIKVLYDRDGEPVWESRHGGPGGIIREKIIFDFPNEVLTHIRGTYGALAQFGPNVVKSLTFYTNKGKYGPYGEERGPTFMTKVNEGKIIGFHGRESYFINSIGFHVKECKVNSYK